MLFPRAAADWARARGLHLRPPRGMARIGLLRRLRPVSTQFGFDRGLPVDRHYIERFLAGHRADIRGRVLEIGDDRYARMFGSEVATVDILDVDAGNPRATIVADLSDPGEIPTGFDCVICTQTLLLVYDVGAAVDTLHGLLAPGGVALVTVPGISRSCRLEYEGGRDYWRFTPDSVSRLFVDRFGETNVGVESYGSVLTAVAFLHGLAAAELRPSELGARDPDFDVIVAARAVKGPAPAP